MGTFKVDGRMTVNTLKDKFKETFGYSLRVYKGNNAGRGARFADDKARLGEIADERESLAGLGEFEMPSEMSISEFEKQITNRNLNYHFDFNGDKYIRDNFGEFDFEKMKINFLNNINIID